MQHPIHTCDKILYAKNIAHIYGKLPTVSDINFSLKSGEILCLLGPSGSGKSTILRLVAGLEAPEQGILQIDDKILYNGDINIPPDKRNIGMVFQDFALFPHLSIYENIVFGLDAIDNDNKEWVNDLLHKIDLYDRKNDYPHNLSGGQQQRVALARAIAPRPDFILLDEPFSGLDARLKDKVRDWTLHILKSNNIGTLLVTHDSEEAMYMGDKIAVMNKGRIEQIGRPDALYLSPATPFVAEFFGENNKIDYQVKNGEISTAFGKFPCPNKQDSDVATLFFRPENLYVKDIADKEVEKYKKTAIIGMVEASSMLGRSSLIHLQMWDGNDFSIHLHARVQGVYAPKAGRIVSLSLEKDKVLIF